MNYATDFHGFARRTPPFFPSVRNYGPALVIIEKISVTPNR
jgi:hypothetical protein